MGTWTTIDHDVRRKYDLSLNEYAVCDTIYILCHGRVCTLKQDEIGEPLGLSRETVCRIIRRLVEKELIIKKKCGFVTSDIWNDEMEVTKGHSRSDEKSQHRVTKSHNESDEKLQSSIRATDSNINNDNSNTLPQAAKPKRSFDEHDCFEKMYEAFKTEYGAFEKSMAVKEMAALWRIVDMAKQREPCDFKTFAWRMVAQFLNIKKNPRKGYEFLAQQPALPSALSSSGIWPRVLETLRQMDEKKPTEKDIDVLKQGLEAIRGAR